MNFDEPFSCGIDLGMRCLVDSSAYLVMINSNSQSDSSERLTSAYVLALSLVWMGKMAGLRNMVYVPIWGFVQHLCRT